MRITSEKTVANFETWAGATDTKNTIMEHGKDRDLDMMLEDLYPDGMTDTQLNDLLWHDSDMVYGWLGIEID